MEILQSPNIMTIPTWADELATLSKLAWTGNDGVCYFPYAPLTTPEFWKTEIGAEWQAGTMHSWILCVDGKIVAHVALVFKKTHWELGRWIAFPDAPKGAVSLLCNEAMKMVNAEHWKIQVECTQAHTSSQIICERLGLRFAGIGILAEINGVWWDIIYYDNSGLAPFVPEPNILGNPLGIQIRSEETHRPRLHAISQIITTERNEDLPPKKFHLLPHLVPIVERILAFNS